MTAPKRQELADGLGISRQMVHRLEVKGMPTHSVEAARQWREANLQPGAAMSNRVNRRRIESDVAVAAVKRLWPVARAALEAGRFGLVEVEMRAALRAVPKSARAGVQVDFDVMQRLVQPVADAVEAMRAEADEAPREVTGAEAEQMGDFWYACAAGEIRVAP